MARRTAEDLLPRSTSASQANQASRRSELWGPTSTDTRSLARQDMTDASGRNPKWTWGTFPTCLCSSDSSTFPTCSTTYERYAMIGDLSLGSVLPISSSAVYTDACIQSRAERIPESELSMKPVTRLLLIAGLALIATTPFKIFVCCYKPHSDTELSRGGRAQGCCRVECWTSLSRGVQRR